MGVAGVVLAAGAGTRLGTPKALVSVRGELLVDRAIGVLRDGGCRIVVVVLGAAAEEVRESARLRSATVVVNERWGTGMGSSWQAGIAALAESTSPEEVHSALILPVDMPGVTAQAVSRVAACGSAEALAAATHGGRRSHPVLIGREHWAAAAATATGDAGARQYLREHPPLLVPCDDVSSGFDVDHPKDLDLLDNVE